MKEKSRMAVEIQELYAQIEVLQQEKVSIKKTVEKLEVQIHEYNIQIQDLNRTVADASGAKQRMQMENQDVTKRLNEMKHAIECAGLDKNKVASQLKELQSNLDNVSRMKHTAESRVHALEQQIKTMTLEVQEQREMRSELERHVIKWKEEGADWKKRYENEARLRIEDVDMLKKKFGAQIADLQVNTFYVQYNNTALYLWSP